MKIFKGTDSKVIGLKLQVSPVASFLWINIVYAFFHLDGTLPETQKPCITNDKKITNF